MVTRKQAEQGAAGSAKKNSDQADAKPKRKTSKAQAGNENLEPRPASQPETGPPSRRKTAAEKKPTPPPATAESKPKATPRKAAAKTESTPKKTTAPKATSRKKTGPEAEPATAPTPAAGRRAAAKAGEASPASKPTRARASRKIEAAAANAAPNRNPEDEGKARQPAAAVNPPTPVDAPIPANLGGTLPHREAAQPAAAGIPIPAIPQEAPAAPGVTRVVLMIRDPEWLYAYWEISPADRERHAIGRPQGAPPLLMRVHDLGMEAQPQDTGNFFDVTVLPDASGWYIHVPQSGGHWRVALGYLNYEGEFVAVGTSNVVTTPNPLHATWNEQTWGPVSMEQQWAEVAGGTEEEVLAPGEPAGPSRLARRAARLMDYLRGGSASGQVPRLGASEQVPRLGASEQVPRLGASEQVPRLGASEQVPRLGVSSEQVPRLGASEQVPRMGASEQFAAPGSGLMMGQQYVVGGEKGKTFWLQVYTELIVYGATEPDASVTVQGQPVRLRPDGTFTLRFALPDGEQVIPVRAVNADGDMERTITPIVTKRTV